MVYIDDCISLIKYVTCRRMKIYLDILLACLHEGSQSSDHAI